MALARRRIEGLDSARTFILAEFLRELEGVDAKVEELQVTPGAYGPRAVARLSTSGRDARSRQPVYVQLAFEWGDWYVVAVHRRDASARARLASAQRDAPEAPWRSPDDAPHR